MASLSIPNQVGICVQVLRVLFVQTFHASLVLPSSQNSQVGCPHPRSRRRRLGGQDALLRTPGPAGSDAYMVQMLTP